MSHNLPGESAWPRNLGRALRDAAAAVVAGVLIGLAYVYFNA